MDRKSVQKEVVRLCRSLIYQMGLDVAGRVKLYKDYSVEVYFYGRKELQEQFKALLAAHNQYNGDEWVEGKYVIYLTIA